jgi:hypothetical protein
LTRSDSTDIIPFSSRALHKRQAVSPPFRGMRLIPRKGGMAMVTYGELIAYTIMLISFASLVLQICKRK